jgi:hypothetical protein
MGRKKAFSIPKIAAAKNADTKPLTCIPSIKYDVAMIENVRINHLRKIPYILFSHNFFAEVPHPKFQATPIQRCWPENFLR